MTTKRPVLPYRRTQSLVRKWTPLPPEFPAPCQSLGRRPWWIVTLPIRGIRRVLTRNNADKGSEFRQSHYIYSNPVKFTEVYSSIKWFVWLNMIYSIYLFVCLKMHYEKNMQQCTKFLIFSRLQLIKHIVIKLLHFLSQQCEGANGSNILMKEPQGAC